MGQGIARLSGKVAGLENELLVSGTEHATATGRDDFVAVKGEYAAAARASGRPALVS